MCNQRVFRGTQATFGFLIFVFSGLPSDLLFFLPFWKKPVVLFTSLVLIFGWPHSHASGPYLWLLMDSLPVLPSRVANFDIQKNPQHQEVCVCVCVCCVCELSFQNFNLSAFCTPCWALHCPNHRPGLEKTPATTMEHSLHNKFITSKMYLT